VVGEDSADPSRHSLHETTAVQRSVAEFTRANISEADRELLKNALATWTCLDDEPLSAIEKPGVRKLLQTTLDIQHKSV
jgi:hypothetical protein